MIPCGSEPAREEPENAAGCQACSVIVDDHREQARSHIEFCVAQKNPAEAGFFL
jgi:hypothetical protein